MRKKWTRCALKLYWLRNAPTTTAGIPSRHGAANSKFSAVVRTHRALVLLAQRVVEATSDRRHKGHPRFRRRLCFSMIIGLSSDADRGKSSATGRSWRASGRHCGRGALWIPGVRHSHARYGRAAGCMLSRNQGMKYRVLIADDHAIMREGVRALLQSDGSVEVVAAVDNGRDAVRLAVALKPDLAVMELTMPQMDGLSAIRELVHHAVPTRILVLTTHKTEEHVRASLKAGAWGYVVKDAGAAELMLAIHSVAQGKKFVSPAVAERVVTGYLSADTGQAGGSPSDVLTPREKEVLKLIAAGRRNREIAGCLSLSVKTGEKHRANVMKKLDLHNTAALTAFAINDATLSAT